MKAQKKVAAKKTQSKKAPAPEVRTLALLKQIERGDVEAECIGAPDRRQLVAILIGDGYSTPEIAQVLKVSDRTVERDRRALREENALPRDPKLTEETVGQLVHEATLAIQHIRKAVRGKSVPPAVKVDGEHRSYQVFSDMVQRLQSLGYLPTAAQKLEADLTHHAGELPDVAEVQVELHRLRAVASEDPAALGQLDALEGELVTVRVAGGLQEVSKRLEMKGGDDGPAQ